jgi:hypothetical protein
MKLVVLLAAAAAALALTATASGKELASLQACGESGCTTVDDGDWLSVLPLEGDTQVPPPKAAAFYVLTYTISDGDPFTVYYVPSSDRLGGNGQVPGHLAWFPVNGAATRAIRDAVAGLEPFPARHAWPAELKSPGRLPASPPDSTAATATDERGGGGWVLWLLIVLATAGVATAGVLVAGRRRPAAAEQS